MKALARILVLLYSPAWRARYGEELEALIEDAGARWTDCFDLLKGALMSHLRVKSWVTAMVVCAAAGLAVAAGIALQAPARYIARSELVLAGSDPYQRSAELRNAESQVLSRSRLNEMVQRDGLYPAEREKLPLEDVVQRMREKDLSVVPSGARVNVTFTYPGAASARQVALEVARDLAVSARAQEVFEPGRPVREGGRVVRSAALGAAIGLAAALLAMSLWRWTVASLWILSFGLVFLAIYASWPVLYMSKSTLAVCDARESAAVREALQDRFWLNRLMLWPNLHLYEAERRRQPMEKLVQRALESTQITESPDALGMVTISFKLRGPAFASPQDDGAARLTQSVLRAMITHAIEDSEIRHRKQNASAPPPPYGMPAGQHPADSPPITVVDPASLPDSPNLDMSNTGFFAAGAAFLAAIGFFIRRRKRKINGRGANQEPDSAGRIPMEPA